MIYTDTFSIADKLLFHTSPLRLVPWLRPWDLKQSFPRWVEQIMTLFFLCHMAYIGIRNFPLIGYMLPLWDWVWCKITIIRFCRRDSKTKSMVFWFNFNWNLAFMIQMTRHWVRQCHGPEQATSHYLNQWWPSLPTHLCISMVVTDASVYRCLEINVMLHFWNLEWKLLNFWLKGHQNFFLRVQLTISKLQQRFTDSPHDVMT